MLFLEGSQYGFEAGVNIGHDHDKVQAAQGFDLYKLQAKLQQSITNTNC